jgi:mevalonate pyrophosphate decarboxylase
MNAQTKMKKLMKYTGMDIWTLCHRLKTNSNEMTSIMLTGDPPSAQTKNKINKFCDSMNLCRECLEPVRRESGCVTCHSCGWSMC